MGDFTTQFDFQRQKREGQLNKGKAPSSSSSADASTSSSSAGGGEESGEAGETEYVKEENPLECRFYENHFPEPEEVVVVNVTEIGEMGAYVQLLEYNNIQGMILLSELSRRRIRSINKLVRVNRTEVVMVIRVDKEKRK